MNINPLAGKLHPPTQQKNKKESPGKSSELFYNRFSENIAEQNKSNAAKNSERYLPDIPSELYTSYGVNVTEDIPQTEPVPSQAVVTTTVRYLAYEQSDYIQVDLPNGCTYRAKVNVSAYQVYVERRTDEGDMEGYMADINSIMEDTKDMIEQFALRSWNKVLEENRQLFGLSREINPQKNGVYPKWKEVPYGQLADETGVISYKGANFICDPEKHALCLGDMSDQKNVLTIPLSEGGSLKVNRDNIGELMGAITMFSAADRELIMRAIQQDKMAQQLKNEIEDEKSQLFRN